MCVLPLALHGTSKKRRPNGAASEACETAVHKLSNAEWKINVRECKGDSGACLYRSVATALGMEYHALRDRLAAATVDKDGIELVKLAYEWLMIARTQRTRDFLQVKKGFTQLVKDGVLHPTFLELVVLHDVCEEATGFVLEGLAAQSRKGPEELQQRTVTVSHAAVQQMKDILQNMKRERQGTADDINTLSDMLNLGIIVFRATPVSNTGCILEGTCSTKKIFPRYLTLYNRDNKHFQLAVLSHRHEPVNEGRSLFAADDLPSFLDRAWKELQGREDCPGSAPSGSVAKQCDRPSSRSRSPKRMGSG